MTRKVKTYLRLATSAARSGGGWAKMYLENRKKNKPLATPQQSGDGGGASCGEPVPLMAEKHKLPPHIPSDGEAG